MEAIEALESHSGSAELLHEASIMKRQDSIKVLSQRALSDRETSLITEELKKSFQLNLLGNSKPAPNASGEI